MARSRDDTDWTRAREPWQRLQWARRTHGAYPTKADFARVVRMTENTYRAYERDSATSSKAIGLDYDNAVAWADRLDVRWQWLLKGEGLPWRNDPEIDLPPEASEASALVAGEDDPERRQLMLDILRTMRRTGTGG